MGSGLTPGKPQVMVITINAESNCSFLRYAHNLSFRALSQYN